MRFVSKHVLLDSNGGYELEDIEVTPINTDFFLNELLFQNKYKLLLPEAEAEEVSAQYYCYRELIKDYAVNIKKDTLLLNKAYIEKLSADKEYSVELSQLREKIRTFISDGGDFAFSYPKSFEKLIIAFVGFEKAEALDNAPLFQILDQIIRKNDEFSSDALPQAFDAEIRSLSAKLINLFIERAAFTFAGQGGDLFNKGVSYVLTRCKDIVNSGIQPRAASEDRQYLEPVGELFSNWRENKGDAEARYCKTQPNFLVGEEAFTEYFAIKVTTKLNAMVTIRVKALGSENNPIIGSEKVSTNQGEYVFFLEKGDDYVVQVIEDEVYFKQIGIEGIDYKEIDLDFVSINDRFFLNKADLGVILEGLIGAEADTEKAYEKYSSVYQVYAKEINMKIRDNLRLNGTYPDDPITNALDNLEQEISTSFQEQAPIPDPTAIALVTNESEFGDIIRNVPGDIKEGDDYQDFIKTLFKIYIDRLALFGGSLEALLTEIETYEDVFFGSEDMEREKAIEIISIAKQEWDNDRRAITKPTFLDHTLLQVKTVKMDGAGNETSIGSIPFQVMKKTGVDEYESAIPIHNGDLQTDNQGTIPLFLPAPGTFKIEINDPVSNKRGSQEFSLPWPVSEEKVVYGGPIKVQVEEILPGLEIRESDWYLASSYLDEGLAKLFVGNEITEVDKTRIVKCYEEELGTYLVLLDTAINLTSNSNAVAEAEVDAIKEQIKQLIHAEDDGKASTDAALFQQAFLGSGGILPSLIELHKINLAAGNVSSVSDESQFAAPLFSLLDTSLRLFFDRITLLSKEEDPKITLKVIYSYLTLANLKLEGYTQKEAFSTIYSNWKDSKKRFGDTTGAGCETHELLVKPDNEYGPHFMVLGAIIPTGSVDCRLARGDQRPEEGSLFDFTTNADGTFLIYLPVGADIEDSANFIDYEVQVGADRAGEVYFFKRSDRFRFNETYEAVLVELDLSSSGLLDTPYFSADSFGPLIDASGADPAEVSAVLTEEYRGLAAELKGHGLDIRNSPEIYAGDISTEEVLDHLDTLDEYLYDFLYNGELTNIDDHFFGGSSPELVTAFKELQEALNDIPNASILGDVFRKIFKVYLDRIVLAGAVSSRIVAKVANLANNGIAKWDVMLDETQKWRNDVTRTGLDGAVLSGLNFLAINAKITGDSPVRSVDGLTIKLTESSSSVESTFAFGETDNSLTIDGNEALIASVLDGNYSFTIDDPIWTLQNEADLNDTEIDADSSRSAITLQLSNTDGGGPDDRDAGGGTGGGGGTAGDRSLTSGGGTAGDGEITDDDGTIPDGNQSEDDGDATSSLTRQLPVSSKKEEDSTPQVIHAELDNEHIKSITIVPKESKKKHKAKKTASNTGKKGKVQVLSKGISNVFKQDETEKKPATNPLFIKVGRGGVPSGKQDLKLLDGVGQKIEDYLNQNGIRNFQDLSSKSISELEDIFSTSKSNPNLKVIKAQANLAKDQRWEELNKYKQLLKKKKK